MPHLDQKMKILLLTILILCELFFHDQLINHGMEISFLEELIKVSKQFFALPLDERLKSSIPEKAFQGYGSDSAYTGIRVSWNDRLLLSLLPQEDRNLQWWPQRPHNFR